MPARLTQRETMRPIDIMATLDVSVRGTRGAAHTYTPPIAKRVINPTLLLPASRNMRKNGKGNSKTTTSRNMFVAAWAAHMAKNSSGIFVPQPTHLPSRVEFQFFAIGRHGNNARTKNENPHMAEITTTDQTHLRATRY